MATFVPYKMYNKIRNFGDALNPLVIEHVSGRRAYYERGAADHVLGIGSIFFYARKSSYVWGSGVIGPDRETPPVTPSRIRAVRGELTLNHLRQAGIAVPDIPLGDPGVFVNELIARDDPRIPRSRVAVVPNHADFKNAHFRRLTEGDDVTLVDMMDFSLKPLLQIAGADVVLSQSLHGLVFAEALGIPSVWISSRTDERWKFKFNDWYSTTIEPQVEPRLVGEPLEDLVAAARLAGSKIDREALRAAFPGEAVREMDDDILGLGNSLKQEPMRIPLALPGGERLLDAFGAEAITDLVQGAYKPAMNRLSFPVYALVGDIDLHPTTVRKMTRIMDENPGCVFGSVIKRADYVDPSPLRNRRGLFTTDSAAQLGQAVIFRPNGRFGPDKKHMLFVVD